jgi:hypothetical protein
MSDNCEAFNCLNFTSVEPSIRNIAAGRSCMAKYAPTVAHMCDHFVWNASNTMKCTGVNNDGKIYPGICGQDGNCWTSGVDYDSVTQSVQDAANAFLSYDSVKNFEAFDE